jgi:hypothetical protein
MTGVLQRPDRCESAGKARFSVAAGSGMSAAGQPLSEDELNDDDCVSSW